MAVEFTGSAPLGSPGKIKWSSFKTTLPTGGIAPEKEEILKAKKLEREERRKKIQDKLIKPLSKDSWIQLNPKAQWDSVVALRGPDWKGSETLKWLTTSVIRHRLSDVMRVGGLINRQLPFVVVPSDGGDAAFGKPKNTFDYNHFLSHVVTASGWLSIPVVQVTGGTFSEAVKSQHWQAVKIISKELNEDLIEVLSLVGFSLGSNSLGNNEESPDFTEGDPYGSEN